MVVSMVESGCKRWRLKLIRSQVGRLEYVVYGVRAGVVVWWTVHRRDNDATARPALPSGPPSAPQNHHRTD